MPSLLSRITSRIGRFFGRKPKAPRIEAEAGHRGLALGSAHPTRGVFQGQIPPARTEEGFEIMPHSWGPTYEVGVSEVDAFLNDGKPLWVNSSNVAVVQFFPPPRGEMRVTFLNGSTYVYSNITIQEGLSFARAQSKGQWVWDYLRVRGSKTAHKKPYRKVAGPITEFVPKK